MKHAAIGMSNEMLRQAVRRNMEESKRPRMIKPDKRRPSEIHFVHPIPGRNGGKPRFFVKSDAVEGWQIKVLAGPVPIPVMEIIERDTGEGEFIVTLVPLAHVACVTETQREELIVPGGPTGIIAP